jgi:hypothetical protein
MTISIKGALKGEDVWITLPDSVLLAATGQICATTTVNFNTSIGGTTRAFIDMSHGHVVGGGGGSDYKAHIGPLSGFETSNAALWLLGNGTARTSNNPTVYSDGTSAIVNAPSGSGNVQFGAGGGAAAFTINFNLGTVTTSYAWCPGYAHFTPVNGAQALTSAQSQANVLVLDASASGGFTLTSTTTAAAGQLQLIRNNTSQTCTFGWATGGTITIATATSALVASDGTNAVKMMAGT